MARSSGPANDDGVFIGATKTLHVACCTSRMTAMHTADGIASGPGHLRDRLHVATILGHCHAAMLGRCYAPMLGCDTAMLPCKDMPWHHGAVMVQWCVP